jgi:hypothetical protein
MFLGVWYRMFLGVGYQMFLGVGYQLFLGLGAKCSWVWGTNYFWVNMVAQPNSIFFHVMQKNKQLKKKLKFFQ